MAKTGEWSLVVMSSVQPYDVLMMLAPGYDRHNTRSQYDGTLMRICQEEEEEKVGLLMQQAVLTLATLLSHVHTHTHTHTHTYP